MVGGGREMVGGERHAFFRGFGHGYSSTSCHVPGDAYAVLVTAEMVKDADQ